MADTRTVDDIDQQIRAAIPESLRDDFDDLLRERDEAKSNAEYWEREADKLQDQCSGLQNTIDEMQDGPDLEDALLQLRYWFHDFLVLGKPVTSPRAMMRLVDETLGPH